MRKVPKYILKNMGIQTQRQYKAQKRFELKMVIAALGKYTFGCAYCPSNNLRREIYDKLNELKELHSVKQWGR